MSGRLPVEYQDWLTYPEVAQLLLVCVGTIRNRMCQHKLKRVLVKTGRRRRLVARVPPETVRTLARLIGTAPYLVNKSS